MPKGVYIRKERTAEHKLHLSEARKALWANPNHKYNSPEFKEKQRIKMVGELNHNYHKQVTEDRKEKQSIAMKKKFADPTSIYNSPEWREKISKQHSDPNSVYQSKEYREKISKANTGKIHSAEAIERHKRARSLQILPKKDTIPEKRLQEELIKRNILFTKHVSLLGQPDIFIKPNICIFCDGEYFHANPNTYSPDYIIWKKKNILAKDIWAKDWNVTRKLTEQNYFVLRFWENEILKDTKSIGNKIEALLK